MKADFSLVRDPNPKSKKRRWATFYDTRARVIIEYMPRLNVYDMHVARYMYGYWRTKTKIRCPTLIAAKDAAYDFLLSVGYAMRWEGTIYTPLPQMELFPELAVYTLHSENEDIG